jgi:hypothetical protein
MFDTNLDRDYRDTRPQRIDGDRHRMEEHPTPALQTWAESQWATEQQSRLSAYARQIEADVLRNFNRLAG